MTHAPSLTPLTEPLTEPLSGSVPPVPPAPPLQPLVAQHFPLWGSRLIEASAGTGKTWTIAALYLRLVLGHGGDPHDEDIEDIEGNEASVEHRGVGFGRPLAPAEILVMTFTRAATRELSDRIRARLVEAACCFRGEQPVPAHDGFLQALLDDHPPGPLRQQAAWRLANAAEGMDDASIHTIDAWCQRMLREHALDSGSLFDETLLPDEKSWLTEAVQDVWRTACYPLPTHLLTQVLAVWKDIPSLQGDVAQLQRLGLPEASPADAASLVALIDQWAAPLRPLWAQAPAQVAAMAAWLGQDRADHPSHWSGTKLRADSMAKWFAALPDWAAQPLPLLAPDIGTGWTRLTPEGLLGARTKSAPPLDLHPAFAWWGEVVAHFTAHPFGPLLRQHAAAQVAQRLTHLKRRGGVAGFADLLQRLHDALHGPHGERLQARVLAQFPVALIDEFQDTSPLQYALFDRVYGVATHARDRALLLIGDPKQSIYGFRGADMHSYLQARLATTGRHYVLTTNHRSTHALVAAVNHCFVQAEATQARGAFRYQTPAGNPLPFVRVSARGRAERLVDGSGPVPALTLVHDLALLSAGEHRQRFAQHCAERIATWLNDAQLGFEPLSQAAAVPVRQRLRPRDIAVLGRTGKEAAAVRRALQHRGVASVYLSERDSVFDSAEARDLVHWLHGVAAPHDATRVRAALATPSVGLALAELHALATDDEAFDQRSQHLAELHTVWQRQGVLAMLRRALHGFGLAGRWLGQPDGERRLSNWLHLAELLQIASAEQDGEAALIRWLERQMTASADRSDEQVVRLESDADLVKVVTLHKSKGLEYPVVCLPFATSFRAVDGRTTTALRLPADGEAEGGEGAADGTAAGRTERPLVLAPDKADFAVADGERLREDLRLLYVGLTRPRHAVWVGFATVRVGNSAACKTHLSALGALLGGDSAGQGDPTPWGERLQALASGCADMALQAAPDTAAVTPLQPADAPIPLQTPTVYAAAFERDWTIASYTRLTRDLKALAGGDLPGMAGAASPLLATQTPRTADDEWPLAGTWPDPAALGLGPDTAAAWVPPGLGAPGVGSVQPQPQPVPAPQGAAPIWHSLAKGPQSGQFLHDQLEWLAAEHFDFAGQPTLAPRLQQRCERAGHAARAPELVAWLQAVSQTPLCEPPQPQPPLPLSLPQPPHPPAEAGPGVALADLRTLRPEMEFWLPAHRLSAPTVDALCHAHWLVGVPRPALAASQWRGMLMGFADLVFEHAGRYWVLDYKSNHLGSSDAAYTLPAMHAAMAQHRYDVQAAIYLLALHRLLRQRLGEAYCPQQHLGGAVYHFVRGWQGPAAGVCVLPAHPALLDALDAMLAGDVPTSAPLTAPPTAPESDHAA